MSGVRVLVISGTRPAAASFAHRSRPDTNGLHLRCTVDREQCDISFRAVDLRRPNLSTVWRKRHRTDDARVADETSPFHPRGQVPQPNRLVVRAREGHKAVGRKDRERESVAAEGELALERARGAVVDLGVPQLRGDDEARAVGREARRVGLGGGDRDIVG